MRVKLTAGRVSSFECPTGKSQAFLWDAEITGLGLKASAGGSKKFILESRLQSGKTIRVTIGNPSAWSIDASRCTGSHFLDTVLQLRRPFVWHKPDGLRGVT